jgi:hypothetical protein
MYDGRMEFPVLLIGFNNLENLKARIHELNLLPKADIYMFLDGPPENSLESDLLKINECLVYGEELLALGVLKSMWSPDSNLGQRIGIPAAINWFFESENFGLILEDDCEIGGGVFNFINYFKSVIEDPENNYAALCASNILEGVDQSRDDVTYFASPFFESWGWATTREKFRRYYLQDLTDVSVLKIVRKNFQFSFLQAQILSRVLDAERLKIVSRDQKTWALGFFLGILKNQALCIYPGSNLVLHHARKDSVHVIKTPKWYKSVKLQPWNPPLKHLKLERFSKFDCYTADKMYGANLHRVFYGVVNRMITNVLNFRK